LLLSVCVLVQTLAQQVGVAVAHTFPQAPQFSSSVFVLVQWPAQQFGVAVAHTLPQRPQFFASVCLLVQTLAQQFGVAAGHTFPQAPQFFGSVFVLVQKAAAPVGVQQVAPTAQPVKGCALVQTPHRVPVGFLRRKLLQCLMQLRCTPRGVAGHFAQYVTHFGLITSSLSLSLSSPSWSALALPGNSARKAPARKPPRVFRKPRREPPPAASFASRSNAADMSAPSFLRKRIGEMTSKR
jgi:hypothetical protein